MDIVVVGAGIVGACIAYRLAEAGARVTVLDAGPPGRGTSGASFAWLNAFSKTPQSYYELNVASIAEHRVLAEELAGGNASWLHANGALHWADSEPEDAKLRANAERLRSWGYPVEWLTPAAIIADLEPDLAFPPDQPAVLLAPGEGWVEVVPLIAALLHAARQYGAEIRWPAAVIGVERTDGRVVGVRLEGGASIYADVVVNCAGPSADGLAQLAGIEYPFKRIPGLLAISAPVAAELKRVCRGPGIHFRPDGGGRILMAEDDVDKQIGTGPQAKGADDLLRLAARYLPNLGGGRIEVQRVGVRPMPPDGLPIVGFVPGIEGFYTVVSHSGVTLGPLWGRVAAAEIVHNRPDLRLAPYRPGRLVATPE